ncbi:MAG: FHA domain-containing protein [Steroidobacteraceae bacterium]|jgi:predicted component of type VI protein secretion system|nr:FHA domain-containing protein [Steroidobacteraceae bacterium]
MALRLRIVSDNATEAGDFDRWTFGVNGGRIGRALDNDWVLIDSQRYISAHHAEIEHRAGEWWICDLSTNGIFINDSQRPLGRGGRHRIADGDRIRVGPYDIVAQVTAGNDFSVEQEFDLTQTAFDNSLDIDLPLPGMPGSAHAGQPSRQPPRPPAPPPAPAATERPSARPAAAEAHKAAPARPAGTDDRALWPGIAAFCKGAGIDPVSLPAEARAQLLQEAGQALRETMLGLMDLSRSRAEFAHEFGVSGSSRQRDATSPLMQLSAVEEALSRLLTGRGPHSPRAVDEVRAQFAKSRHHQQATLVALREAIPALLERLDPDALEEQFGRSSRGPASADMMARYWARYREMHKAAMARGESGLPPAFVEEFARAYQALTAAGLRPASLEDDRA